MPEGRSRRGSSVLMSSSIVRSWAMGDGRSVGVI